MLPATRVLDFIKGACLAAVVLTVGVATEAAERFENGGALVTISTSSPSTEDQVSLDVRVLGWDITLRDLRRRLRDEEFSSVQQRGATSGFRSNDRVLSFAYTVMNKTETTLTLYGRQTIGLGDLPMVVSLDGKTVDLLVTPYLDPNVDFDQLPYIIGSKLRPGEKTTMLASLSYPLKDSWKLKTVHDPDNVSFCVGLTTDTEGMSAEALGQSGVPGRYWPMGGTAPITVCQTLSR